MVEPMHITIYKHLEDGPKTTAELCKLMPNDKPVSIRSIITQKPDKFIRIADGIVGRKNRDEYLQEFYKKLTVEKVIEILREVKS
jgi:hypothetical protein